MTESDTVKHEINFHGSLGTAPAKAQFAASIRFSQYDPTTLDVDILWLGDDSSARMGSAVLFPSPGGSVSLRPEDPAYPIVEIFGIWEVSTGGKRSSVRANGIRVGIDRTRIDRDTRYIVKAELRPSGILGLPKIREASFTGEIKNREILTGKAEVRTDLGVLEACERYDHFTTTDVGDEVMHTVRRAAIVGEATALTGASLADIDSKLQEIGRAHV